MNSKDDLMTARFLVNMRRINGLVKLTQLDVDALGPTDLFRSEGPRADILRAIVVFLHATFEDVLRSRANQDYKKFSIYSGVDIEKVLRKCRLDPAPFKPLFPPLTQLAKRRKRIVHDADLPNRTATASEAWTITDHWQLIMWLLAVPAFHLMLCMSMDHKDQAAREKYRKLREAMGTWVDFGKQLVVFPKTTPDMDLQTSASRKALATLESVAAILGHQSC
jgi:hypothetical protein